MNRWTRAWRNTCLPTLLLLGSLGYALAGEADERFDEALDLVQRKYLHELTHEQLTDRALRALLRDLDPYSSYLDADQWEGMKQDLAAHFGGIGVSVGFEEATGRPRVRMLMYGSAAAAAGVRRGDFIAAVDGRDVGGISIDELLPLLRGEPGSAVELRVLRDGSNAPIDLRVVRARLEMPSVRGVRRDPDGRQDYLLDPARGIGYIRVSRMAEDGVPAVEVALAALEQQRMRALVLDLRGSSGGLMRAARGIADLFVDEGMLFGQVSRDSSESYRAEAGSLTQVPLAVLIDAQTASSSEFLAAALRDCGRARFVGARTFGKARLQEMLSLDGGGGLVLTTARLVRAAGPFILEPSDLPPSMPDRVLLRAVEVLNSDPPHGE